MATYEYFCLNKECSSSQDEEHSMNGFKEYRPKCNKCGSECEYRYVPSIIEFSMPDGPSGTTPSKAIRIKQQMLNRSKAASKRQRDRYGEAKKAIPNFEGKITGEGVDGWQEAKSLAIKEHGLEIAPTYNKKIEEVKKTKIIV